MSKSITVYCVDDDKVNLLLLEKILADYECILLDSGQACLDAIHSNPPDLILLDVIMTELGGLETCRKLREDSEFYHIPIIFLSSNQSIEDRLEGYAAGGDDFVGKPFDADELLAKVKASLKRKNILDTARKEAKDAHSSTVDIMTTMGEMSTVVHFLHSTFSCKSYESLARKIINAHESLGLEVALEFIVNNEKQHYSTADVESPLEESVFEFVRNKGRLVNFGERAAVNYPNVIILIRNMPVEDPDLHGRIRDHIALIGQGADSKIKALKSELMIKSQRENLIQVVNQLQKTVIEVDADYKGQQEFSERILSTVGNSLEDSFVTLGLTVEQEELQRRIIVDAEEQTKMLYTAGLALDEKVETILKQIHLALEDMTIEEDDDDNDDDTSGESVSLF